MYSPSNQKQSGSKVLRTLPTQPPCKSKILWLDSNTLGMDSSKIGIFKQRDKVSLCSLLQRHHSRRLETQVSLYNTASAYESSQIQRATNLEVLRNFTHKTLEGQLPNKQLGRLLVTTNFTKSDCSRTESMRLLYTTSRLQRQSQSTFNVLGRGSSRWPQSCAQKTWLQVVYVEPCLQQVRINPKHK